MESKYIIDMHTHTISSGHGYSTLKENIEMAKKRGLKVLGLSEHGPAMPGGPHIFFFQNYKCINREYDGLKLYCGVEANIINKEGEIDIPEDTLKKVDYCIASMHVPCVKSSTAEENTDTLIQTMKNPYVKIIGHPDDSRYPLDYEKLVKAAKKENVLLEVNNSSLHPKAARQGGRENVLSLLKECKKQDAMIILGSDSHMDESIGDFSAAEKLLKEVDFPERLIMNLNIENLYKVIN